MTISINPEQTNSALRVYRLATSSRPARMVGAEPAVRAGRWHDVGDRVVYAYESEALAALSLSQLTQGVEPAELVYETFELPQDRQLHGEFDLRGEGRTRRTFHTPGVVRLPILNLSFLMRERKLLTLWVTSPYSTIERTVLINAAHPAFSELRIESHVLPGTSFFSTGPCGEQMSESWASTEARADFGPTTMMFAGFPPQAMSPGTPCF